MAKARQEITALAQSGCKLAAPLKKRNRNGQVLPSRPGKDLERTSNRRVPEGTAAA